VTRERVLVDVRRETGHQVNFWNFKWTISAFIKQMDSFYNEKVGF
jgi:hypothetical protein